MPDATVWITWSIFALTYAGLALGRIPGTRMDRAAIALVGATAMLCSGALSLRDAVAPDSIDYDTLLLLFGMMVVVAFLQVSGVLALLTRLTLARIRTPRMLLAAVIILSGVLSALLVNDVVCVAITPLIVHVVKRLRFDPLPPLIGLATAANIGSVATLTGNPQNMMIGVQSQLSYLDFALHLAPLAVLGLLLDFALICLVYRHRLVPPSAVPRIAGHDATIAPPSSSRMPHRRQRRLQAKSAAVALLAVALFFMGLPIALVALGAAAVLMIDRLRPERIYSRIDWRLLVMFAGLFVVVHAFQLRIISTWHVDGWAWLSHPSIGLLSLAAAALSNLVSNVPAVLLMAPTVHAIAPAAQASAWLTLAMSSTLAGNLTVLGSVANLIVVESARRAGVQISFREYLRVGVPITLLTLALGITWLQFIRW